MAKPVVLKFLGDTASLEASFKRVQAGAKGVEGSTTKTSSGMHKMGVAAKVASVAVLGMGVALVKGFVQAGMNAETTQTRLNKVLVNTHQNSAKNIDIINKYAAAEKSRGFSADAVRDSLTRLITSTHNVTAATHLSSVASDLARAKNISLTQAADILARAHAGQFRALKSLGIMVPKVTTAQDALKASTQHATDEQKRHAKALDHTATSAKALALLEKNVHGQAAAFATTDAGKIDVFKASWQNLQQSIGEQLIPILSKLMGWLNSLMGFISAHKTTVEVLAGAVGGLAIAVWGVNAAGRAWIAVQAALDVVLAANPIGLVVIAVAALAAAFYLAWQHSQTFRDIVKGAFDVVKTVALDVANFFTVDVVGAFKAVISWLQGNWPAIATIISGPFAPIVALATNAFGIRSALVDAFNAVKNAVAAAIDAVVGFVKGIGSRVAAVASGAFDALMTALHPFVVAVQDAIGLVEKFLNLFGKSSGISSGPSVLGGRTGSYSAAPGVVHPVLGPPAPVTRATGGFVPGNPGAGDVVPMMLTAGEVILNTAQQMKVGKGVIHKALGSTAMPIDVGALLAKTAAKAVHKQASGIATFVKHAVHSAKTAVPKVAKPPKLPKGSQPVQTGYAPWLGLTDLGDAQRALFYATKPDDYARELNNVNLLSTILDSADAQLTAAQTASDGSSAALSAIAARQHFRNYADAQFQMAQAILGSMTTPADYSAMFVAMQDLIPHMAAGGIVHKPTLAMIGERGPERVTPLGSGGGGNTYYLTVHSVDPTTAGAVVINALDAWERRNGPRYARV